MNRLNKYANNKNMKKNQKLIRRGGWLAAFLAVFTAAQALQAEITVTVMTCNVRTPKQQDSTTGDGWESRKDFCIATIKKRNPDIIGFQECTRQQFDDFRAAWPDYTVYGLTPESPLSVDPYEVIFAAPRFRLISSAGYWISETPNIPGSRSWDNSRHPRDINWMRLVDKQSGIEFRVMNTHFDQKGQQAREHGAQLAVADARAFPPDYPQLFTGDLNAEVTNPAIAIMKNGGWIDSWEQLHGDRDPGFTAHDFLGDKFTTGDHHGKIDWIFYRGNLKPLASEIIRDQRNGHYPSDHYFVVAKFLLGEKQ
jgi:endonuclease/exonuclease/phosphatase family metal-dependent hydrolase